MELAKIIFLILFLTHAFKTLTVPEILSSIARNGFSLDFIKSAEAAKWNNISIFFVALSRAFEFLISAR